ncbi:hypothetical protein PanWU01x14_315590, partial [Parasponia andersonii]
RIKEKFLRWHCACSVLLISLELLLVKDASCCADFCRCCAYSFSEATSRHGGVQRS